VTVTLSAGSGYDADDKTVTVPVTDDDTAEFTLGDDDNLTLNEGDATGDSFTVLLATRPSAEVTVTVTTSNSDVTIDTDPSMAGNQNTMTFQAFDFRTNPFFTKPWYQSQTVTLVAAHDDDKTMDSATITITAAGGDYNGLSTTVSVPIIDDDTPRGDILVFPRDTLDIEEGESNFLDIRLSDRPAENARISLSKTNSDITIAPASLTFTVSNYTAAQRVTVSAAEDSDADDEIDTITLSASGGIVAPAVAKPVTIADDDLPTGAIRITPAGTLSIPEGESKELFASLSTAPDSNVNIQLSKSNPDITLIPNFLDFTPSNYDTPQSITVVSRHDLDTDNDSETITFSQAAGGIILPNATKAVTIIDDDSPTPTPQGTILLSPSEGLTLDEGGTRQQIDVSLSVEPDAGVTVSLSRTNPNLELDKTSLAFTPSNHAEPQTITLRAIDDDDSTDDTITITLEASGGIDAPPATIEVTVNDDDPPPVAPVFSYPGGILVTPSGPADIPEGGRLSLLVSLDTEPAENLTVSLSKSNPDLTLSTDSLVFTPSNWNVQVKVDITAADDARALSDTDTIVFSALGRTLHRLALSVLDNDADILYRPQTLEIPEGGVGTLFIRPSKMPSAERPIVVRLLSRNGFVSFYPPSLTFTPSNWEVEAPVNLFAIVDENTIDEYESISIEATGGSFHLSTMLILIKDNETVANPDWEVKSRALAIPPTSAQDTASIRIRCNQDTPCRVFLDCSTQAGRVLRGYLPQIQAGATSTVVSGYIQRQVGAWSGWEGRLGCSLLSEDDISAQVWTRSGDGVLVNNSAVIRSVPVGDIHRADIESIPSPDAFDLSNIRIRCDSPSGDCTRTAFVCYTDDGKRYETELGDILRWATRHLQSEELANLLGHRWPGLGLSCEVRSDGQFTAQILTRTGGGGALVNNSATGR
uniref:hypothetical protein n=1 Tax=Thioalkalivibrio sp. HK1 TaxID=1469245 RepID=UPI0018CC0017